MNLKYPFVQEGSSRVSLAQPISPTPPPVVAPPLSTSLPPPIADPAREPAADRRPNQGGRELVREVEGPRDSQPRTPETGGEPPPLPRRSRAVAEGRSEPPRADPRRTGGHAIRAEVGRSGQLRAPETGRKAAEASKQPLVTTRRRRSRRMERSREAHQRDRDRRNESEV